MGPRDRYGGSEFGVGAGLNRNGVNVAADEENRRGRFPTPVITPGGKPKRAKESTDRGDQAPSLIPSVGRDIGILQFGILPQCLKLRLESLASKKGLIQADFNIGIVPRGRLLRSARSGIMLRLLRLRIGGSGKVKYCGRTGSFPHLAGFSGSKS